MVRHAPHKLTEEDVRRLINARLRGRPLNDREWYLLLVKWRFVSEIQRDRRVIDEAVERINEIRWLQEDTEKPQPDENSQVLSKAEAISHPDYSVAFSLLLYEEATKDAKVNAFRTEVLANKLLDREAVPGWVEEQAEADGKANLWLQEIPVPPEYEREIRKRWSHLQETSPLKMSIPVDPWMQKLAFHSLKYGGSGNQAYAVPTRIGGVLDRLRILSERLASEYAWQEAQATLFILTGTVPLISPIQVTLKMSKGPLYSRQLIILDVDVRVSPQEVAKHYRLARREIKARRRGKLSEKHLRLATFDAERPEGESWRKKLAEWNRTERPEWRYGNDPRRFAHECLHARRRILDSSGRMAERKAGNR